MKKDALLLAALLFPSVCAANSINPRAPVSQPVVEPAPNSSGATVPAESRIEKVQNLTHKILPGGEKKNTLPIIAESLPVPATNKLDETIVLQVKEKRLEGVPQTQSSEAAPPVELNVKEASPLLQKQPETAPEPVISPVAGPASQPVRTQNQIPVAVNPQGTSRGRVVIINVGDLLGEVSEKKASPEETKAPFSKVGETLQIPKEGGIEFLEGTWRCDMGDLRDVRTGQSIQVEFTFNRDGTGITTIQKADGHRFKGSVKGELSDGVLRLQTTPYISLTGAESSYNPQSFECRQEGEQKDAVCSGHNTVGRRIDWKNVKFTRVK